MLATDAPGTSPAAVLLCLSHLRWDFVFQRPQHLMSRAAADYQVVFFEEAMPSTSPDPSLRTRRVPGGVLVATPMLPDGLDAAAADAAQTELLETLLAELAAPLALVWYYTPMAVGIAGHLRPATTVFDSMDELSAFRGASPRLALLERRLLRRADLVFNGGHSLHEAKRGMHPDMHLFPSSVDAAHFRTARQPRPTAAEPADQVGLARPRVGFFGVIDERLDYALLDAVATARPDWQLVMLGPTAKIDPDSLPQRPNLHWLGMKAYADLPDYLAGWDAGMMPFALNEATRFISPTKTPEFLAAGVPLVSTPVADVVYDWQHDGLVEIADGPEAMVAAIGRVLARPRAPWQAKVDHHMSRMSWDATWTRMSELIDDRRQDTPARRVAGAASRAQVGLVAPASGQAASARIGPRHGAS